MNIKRALIGLVAIFALCSFLTTQDLIYTSHTKDFVFPKLERFNPDEFPSFTTAKAHKFGYADDGSFQLEGEQYTILLNIAQISHVHPFEDTQENEGAMVFMVGADVPILLIQPFEDVMKSIKKAAAVR